MTARIHPVKSALGLVGFGALVSAAALVGARTTRKNLKVWYRSLHKPPFQPPRQAFGPVWTTLYAATAVAGWRLWRAPAGPHRDRALRLWFAQLAANAAWTPLFFGAHRARLALADLGAYVWLLSRTRREARFVDSTASRLLLPVQGWALFAGALNEEIVRRNGARA